MAAPDVFPCPVFEGSEKRISVTFSAGGNTPQAGLRTLTRTQLDFLLDLAACQIVSTRPSACFDAYVLSESSLFVYPDRMVLKTCGTTKLLSCVPHMVALAAGLGMTPARVKYSRASFLFPEHQPAPHTSFDAECGALHALFSGLGAASAYVLGDALAAGLQWHVYVAGAHPAALPALGAPVDRPLHTLEVCMTGLSTAKAAQFFRSDDFQSARTTTLQSGIQALVPAADIDDYVFEPCGYSMNGVELGGTFSTVHITPEDGFSYASFELCGYNADEINTAELVAGVAEVFHPRHMSVALSLDSLAPAAASSAWGAPFMAPMSYACHSASYQEVRCGGYVAYFTLESMGQGAPSAPPSPVAAAAAAAKPASSTDSGSPRGVVKHFPSFTAGSVITDLDLLGDRDSDNSSVRNCGTLCNSLLIEPQDMDVGDVLTLHGAANLPKGDVPSLDAHMRQLISDHRLEDNFYVVDLGALQRLHAAWGEQLPRVAPFYAVKCNPDPAVLATLAALGAGFDCASEAEIAAVLALGVPPQRIIFANPCKRGRDIRFAADKGVELSTFDSEGELAKLAAWQPGARALLRIRADDAGARCQLGNKYGAEVPEWDALLGAARALGVAVEGVSFHVGSGATNPAAFSYAIELARSAFDLGLAHGFDMKLLDIGGGFCGGQFGPDGRVDLGGVPAAVNSALAAHFPDDGSVRVIAEPGRYFAESVASMACMVYGRRACRGTPEAPAPLRRVHSLRRLGAGAPPAGPGLESERELGGWDYWVTDGLYGSMNSVLYDHATLSARPLMADPCAPPGEVLPSTVFGPTCDGLDTLLRDYPLPELEVGDWLVFPAMGAYTICGASRFNGINAVDVPTFYIASRQA